ncbi:uncharacterized protein LOC122622060 [Drosophila teissieri]|uniref:uncharacterized protein LOC122622060 n=1 Tax=Drosophila teissieri TaxID=7243 RepID=UPI001CBA50DF|nr:uncharacterized protein LOC122622060 [Drosophila teissieri]
MDELLNLILNGIQLRLEESAEDSDEDIEGVMEGMEDEGELDGPDTRLLYYFSRLYNVLSGNIFLTTYVERGRREYFAGFSNVQLVAPFQGDRQSKRYRWIHLSLIFRAFRSTTGS